MLRIGYAASAFALTVSLFAYSAGYSYEAVPAAPVEIVAGGVELADVPISVAVPGSIVSDGRIDVSSRIIGFVEQLDVREGQEVSRGDVLVRIDSTDVDAAIRQARGALRAAEKTLEDSQLDAEKYRNLSTSGTISSEALRKAELGTEIARINLDKAQSAVKAAEAQKEYTTITSPVDGVIVSVAKRRGEMATTGAPLVTVESREVLLFKAYISERDLAAIDTEQTVPIRIDSLGDRVFEGRFRGIVPSADEVTRRYEINVVMPKTSALLPGMFGRAEIVLGHQKAPVVPISALVNRGGLEGVFVLADGKAAFRWLRLGKEWNGLRVVTAGLNGGETIALKASDRLRDGSAIAAVENAQ